jgi:muramidase (phage lysozyme)
MNVNEKAFLDTIAYSEGTYGIGDDGYNVLVGSTKSAPLLFDSYDDHPRVYNKKFNSTAAGRYQILAHIYDSYKELLNLPNFSPESQNAIAMQIIKERHALTDIDTGNVDSAVMKCSNIWASFPGNNYGQHENKLVVLQDFYTNVGGNLTS